MEINGRRTCEDCIWWGRERAHQHDNPYGRCRVEPPKKGATITLPYHDPDRPTAAGPMIPRGEWPWTAFDNWCGEFSPTRDAIRLGPTGNLTEGVSP